MYKPEGIIVALVTPMTEDEQVDEKKLRNLVNRCIEGGVHGLFCLSTNGEFFTLTNEEKKMITEIVLDENNGRIPVLSGTGGVTTGEVIELTQSAEEMGVDAVSIITPYFLTPSQEELYQHYKTVADSVSVPIILYNLPGRTGVALEYPTVARLSEIDNIIGVKDSSGNFDNTLRYLEETDDEFAVFSGNDSLVLWTLVAGGTGGVCGTANIFPKTLVSIYNLWKEGKFDQAKEVQDSIRPLRNSLTIDTFPSTIKKIMELIGVPVGPPRRPILPPSSEIVNKLKKVLRENYDIDV